MSLLFQQLPDSFFYRNPFLLINLLKCCLTHAQENHVLRTVRTTIFLNNSALSLCINVYKLIPATPFLLWFIWFYW